MSAGRERGNSVRIADSVELPSMPFLGGELSNVVGSLETARATVMCALRELEVRRSVYGTFGSSKMAARRMREAPHGVRRLQEAHSRRG